MATVRDLVRAAVRAAEEKKAKDVKAIDLRGLSAVTDYMVIATGSSDTNVRAIAEGVREKLLEKGERPFSTEGLSEGTWVLLDYVDFVLHVFHHEKRAYFGLEQLWADAKPVPVASLEARTAAARAGAKTAARGAAKQPPPGAPRTAPKPSPRTSAAATKAVGARKRVTGKPAGKPAAAVPKPRKAAVPKRKAKG